MKTLRIEQIGLLLHLIYGLHDMNYFVEQFTVSFMASNIEQKIDVTE